ncbi:MAG: DsbA family oxidoreductase [Saprospiraceae bacterium]|nr:DsbA family oxidoreductase [Saprospiraceae bacterium]
MTIEIWSDIMCPFCYIGKRKLEAALEQFEGKNEVEIVWRSFQLDPDMENRPHQDLFDYLAERKGQTRAWSIQAHEQVSQAARAVGLEYNFDKAVPANSFDAHQLIQLAKRSGRGDAAEERLFRAYFTEGKNVSDPVVLAALGADIGLEGEEVLEVLRSGAMADAVRKDMDEARRLELRGVPFFVFNRAYAVSGAQPVEVFLQALHRAL